MKRFHNRTVIVGAVPVEWGQLRGHQQVEQPDQGGDRKMMDEYERAIARAFPEMPA